MSKFDLDWGDDEEPEITARTLDIVDTTRDQQRAETQAKLIAERVEAAVDAVRPGLHKIPDPVDPAGEGALTREERKRLELCEQGIELHDVSWFMLGKALDTVATGRLFRDTPHKLEPERCYGSIEEWAEVEKGISVSRCSQLRAAWPIGEVLMARGYDANPGQVRELVPVKNAYGLNAAVAVYVMVANSVGADKVTAARLREAVKLLPGDLQLETDEDPDVLARTIQGVLVGEAPQKPAVAIPPAVKRAVDARAIKLADALDRGRIPRAEVQLHLLEAFADPDDPVVFNAVLDRMKRARQER
jgi:chorismate mutase